MKWMCNGHQDALKQAIAETQPFNKVGSLRREYVAALYLLTGMEYVWPRLEPYVNRGSMDYEGMLDEPLSRGEQLIVGLAGNLFNGGTYVRFTPMDLIECLDDDMLELAINGIALRRNGLSTAMLMLKEVSA